MRVWLVDDRHGADAASLEGILQQLAAASDGALVLLGARAFWPDFAAELRAQSADVVVIHEPAWPDGPWTQQLLELGVAVVVSAARERSERYRAFAETYPVLFVPPAPGADCLWLALQGARAAQRRHEQWKGQVNRLQQRLSDRIIIERAKGVLVERMGITEEDAYNRLRVLSRRQRRQIRDIAQSLLDTEALFLPGTNGSGSASLFGERAEGEKPTHPPA
jgi:hypothetical protein